MYLFIRYPSLSAVRARSSYTVYPDLRACRDVVAAYVVQRRLENLRRAAFALAAALVPDDPVVMPS